MHRQSPFTSHSFHSKVLLWNTLTLVILMARPWADAATVDQGGLTSGAGFSGSAGQTAVIRRQSENRRVDDGFWYGAACDCRYHGDIDADGVMTVFDVVVLVNVAFRGGDPPVADPYCPHINRGDLSCDGQINVFDVVLGVAAAFRGDDQRCNPCTDM
jgi:hypothetical protein